MSQKDASAHFVHMVRSAMKRRYPHMTFNRADMFPAEQRIEVAFHDGGTVVTITANDDTVRRHANQGFDRLEQLAAERVRMCTLGLGEPVSVPSLPSEALAQAA